MVWFFNDDERLAPEADLLVLMRNRQYLPRMGRFLQPDPNATGVAVQPSLAYGGSALPTPDPYVDLHSWAADGTSALAYALSDPVNKSDPNGLSLLGLLGTTAIRAVEYASPSFGGVLQSVAFELIDEYAWRQDYDVQWAMDWYAPDDWHTRGENDWVKAAIGRGMYNGFEVGIPFTEVAFNPLDLVASSTEGTAPGIRVPPKEVLSQGGVFIKANYGSKNKNGGPEHGGPAHLDVWSDGQRMTRVGPNGYPLKGNRALTPKEMRVFRANRVQINKAIRQIQTFLRNTYNPKSRK